VTEGFEITLHGKPKRRVCGKVLDGIQEAKIIAWRQLWNWPCCCPGSPFVRSAPQAFGSSNSCINAFRGYKVRALQGESWGMPLLDSRTLESTVIKTAVDNALADLPISESRVCVGLAVTCVDLPLMPSTCKQPDMNEVQIREPGKPRYRVSTTPRLKDPLPLYQKACYSNACENYHESCQPINCSTTQPHTRVSQAGRRWHTRR
jgi:hypothetical protein